MILNFESKVINLENEQIKPKQEAIVSKLIAGRKITTTGAYIIKTPLNELGKTQCKRESFLSYILNHDRLIKVYKKENGEYIQENISANEFVDEKHHISNFLIENIRKLKDYKKTSQDIYTLIEVLHSMGVSKTQLLNSSSWGVRNRNANTWDNEIVLINFGLKTQEA